MDANPEDIKLTCGEIVKGHGKGFSAFLGCSTNNTMWIASVDSQYQLVDKTLIKFGKGDCLILPYGTIHAGDKNDSNAVTYKLFSDVSTICIPDNQSQLWVKPGEGFRKGKKDNENTDEDNENTDDVKKSTKRKRS